MTFLNNIHNTWHKILRTLAGTILLKPWFIILTLVFSTIHMGKKRVWGGYPHAFPYNLKLCHQHTHIILVFSFWYFNKILITLTWFFTYFTYVLNNFIFVYLIFNITFKLLLLLLHYIYSFWRIIFDNYMVSSWELSDKLLRALSNPTSWYSHFL